MKIAVYFDDLSPMAGGGFTFQDDLFRALLATDQRRHSFVIFSRLPPATTAALARPHVTFVSTPSKQWIKLQYAISVAFSREVFIANAMGLHGWFHRAACRHGAEFVWFATPA